MNNPAGAGVSKEVYGSWLQVSYWKGRVKRSGVKKNVHQFKEKWVSKKADTFADIPKKNFQISESDKSEEIIETEKVPVQESNGFSTLINSDPCMSNLSSNFVFANKFNLLDGLVEEGEIVVNEEEYAIIMNNKDVVNKTEEFGLNSIISEKKGNIEMKEVISSNAKKKGSKQLKSLGAINLVPRNVEKLLDMITDLKEVGKEVHSVQTDSVLPDGHLDLSKSNKIIPELMLEGQIREQEEKSNIGMEPKTFSTVATENKFDLLNSLLEEGKITFPHEAIELSVVEKEDFPICMGCPSLPSGNDEQKSKIYKWRASFDRISSRNDFSVLGKYFEIGRAVVQLNFKVWLWLSCHSMLSCKMGFNFKTRSSTYKLPQCKILHPLNALFEIPWIERTKSWMEYSPSSPEFLPSVSFDHWVLTKEIEELLGAQIKR
ncbi:hypothetical protein MA16_Dca020589 [Dendrobium catenatum]|uniref:Uncharacterized protein n=1 Tax=Dendrobium catenatum TaxID=906689 RepID=A0A2I0VSA5_9ASPA|nr:hypothetical protein MA16_Dca020589 [Dendrobium catenatum]